MQTTTDMVRNYSQTAVHKLASQISNGSSILGSGDNAGQPTNLVQSGKLGSFVSLASGPSDTKRAMERPPQPSFTIMSKNPQNLG